MVLKRNHYDSKRRYNLQFGLAETVKAQLAKVGDTSSNGRDGKDGTSGAKGLTGKDGLNDKTLTEKVNALRNGEAGSVVYTDENGTRLVKAKDGEYYKAADVDKDGNVLNGAPKSYYCRSSCGEPRWYNNWWHN